MSNIWDTSGQRMSTGDWFFQGKDQPADYEERATEFLGHLRRHQEEGGTLILHLPGESSRTVRIENDYFRDDKGQRWGLMPIVMSRGTFELKHAAPAPTEQMRQELSAAKTVLGPAQPPAGGPASATGGPLPTAAASSKPAPPRGATPASLPPTPLATAQQLTTPAAPSTPTPGPEPLAGAPPSGTSAPAPSLAAPGSAPTKVPPASAATPGPEPTRAELDLPEPPSPKPDRKRATDKRMTDKQLADFLSAASLGIDPADIEALTSPAPKKPAPLPQPPGGGLGSVPTGGSPAGEPPPIIKEIGGNEEYASTKRRRYFSTKKEPEESETAAGGIFGFLHQHGLARKWGEQAIDALTHPRSFSPGHFLRGAANDVLKIGLRHLLTPRPEEAKEGGATKGEEAAAGPPLGGLGSLLTSIFRMPAGGEGASLGRQGSFPPPPIVAPPVVTSIWRTLGQALGRQGQSVFSGLPFGPGAEAGGAGRASVPAGGGTAGQGVAELVQAITQMVEKQTETNRLLEQLAAKLGGATAAPAPPGAFRQPIRPAVGSTGAAHQPHAGGGLKAAGHEVAHASMAAILRQALPQVIEAAALAAV